MQKKGDIYLYIYISIYLYIYIYISVSLPNRIQILKSLILLRINNTYEVGVFHLSH